MREINGKFTKPRQLKPADFLLSLLSQKGLSVTGLSAENESRALQENETVHEEGGKVFYLKWALTPSLDDIIKVNGVLRHLRRLSQ